MTISAVVGCAIRNAIKDHPWLAIPLAVALSIVLMELTRTVHPPGKHPCTLLQKPIFKLALCIMRITYHFVQDFRWACTNCGRYLERHRVRAVSLALQQPERFFSNCGIVRMF